MPNSIYLKSVAVVVTLCAISFTTSAATERQCDRAQGKPAIITALVSCRMPNTTLNALGISNKSMHDVNSDAAAKILSANKPPIRPIVLITNDGEFKTWPLKIGVTVDIKASIVDSSHISLDLDWKKNDPNREGPNSFKTSVSLTLDRAAIINSRSTQDYTYFVIATVYVEEPQEPVRMQYL